MLVGLTGKNGSGKGTVARWLTERGFAHDSLSDRIREDLRARGLPITREHLIASGRRLRAEHGPGVLAERTLERLQGASHSIVDSVRNPAEVDVLRRRDDFVLIEVQADARTRFERIQARGRHGDAQDFATFLAHDEAELGNQSAHAQQLDRTAALADHVVHNNADLATLQAQLEALLAQWTARGLYTTAP